MDAFVQDMEQGSYAPESTNSIRRLNDVVRRYEEMLLRAGCTEILSEESESEEEEEEEQEEGDSD